MSDAEATIRSTLVGALAKTSHLTGLNFVTGQPIIDRRVA